MREFMKQIIEADKRGDCVLRDKLIRKNQHLLTDAELHKVVEMITNGKLQGVSIG